MIKQIEPYLDNEENKQIREVMKSKWITEGKKTKEFETLVKKYTKSKYVLSTNNGTSALYMCLKALGIKKGDRVIVPNLTFTATANAVKMLGAEVDLVDTDAYNINPRLIKIKKNTKAIIPVHLYGEPARMKEINQIARKHNLYVIEDAAQAIGVWKDKKHAGTMGDLGILSFYGNKTITSAEGGMILGKDKHLMKRLFMLKNHGRERKGTFKHEQIGFNFCTTDLNSAIGVAQMKKLTKILKRKKKINQFYGRELIYCSEVIVLDSQVNWMNNMLVENPEKMQIYLKRKGIETRRFFLPLNRQKPYLSKKEFPESDFMYSHGLSLPSSASLTKDQLQYICDSIRGFFK